MFSLLLSGCASQQTEVFIPFTVEINSQEAYKTDLKICREYAQEYITEQGQLNPSQMAQEGATGALGGIPYIPTSPATPFLPPLLGALGGSSQEAIRELGLDSNSAKKIVSWCMHDKGLKDGFSSWDPNL